MPSTVPTQPHLWRDDAGEVWIDETPYKVTHLVAEHLAHGWSAEALHENHPDLSLAQIYAALAWYYDHAEEVEERIDLQEARAKKVLDELGSQKLRQKLSLLKARREA